MTKRLLLAMAIGSVVLGCNKDSTVNRDDPGAGGEAGAGATGGAIEGSGGRTTGGTGGTTEGSGGGTTGGVSTGGSSTGGEGGDTEPTGGEGGEATTTGGASTGGTAGEGGEAEATGGEGGTGATTGGEGGAIPTTGGDGSGGTATGGDGGGPTNGGAGTGGVGGATDGGAGPGGAGGAGGTDSTVRGRLIDFWRNPLPGVRVEVSGTVTTTNDAGEFEVADVPAVYDATFVIESIEDNVNFSHGWVYQDLTRRDPTLQVYRGFPNRTVAAEFQGENLIEIDEPLLAISVAGPYGTFATSTTNPALHNPLGIEWFGPTETPATAHALLMRLDPDTDFPTAYVAYDSPLIALVMGAPDTVSLDLSPDEIPTGNLLGTVTGLDDPSRNTFVYARFPTGGSIELLTDAAAPSSFSYLVPNLPQGSLTVATSVTDANGGLALAHQDGLSAGSDPVALTLPTPSSLSVPADGTTGVDSTRPFRFVGSPDSDAYLVVMSNGFNTKLYTVTSREELTIPEVLGGDFQLRPDDLMYWWVETHGDAGSVDELAAPGGFLDAFSFTPYPEPMGPRLGSGQYTESDYRSFTTAP